MQEEGVAASNQATGLCWRGPFVLVGFHRGANPGARESLWAWAVGPELELGTNALTESAASFKCIHNDTILSEHEEVLHLRRLSHSIIFTHRPRKSRSPSGRE